jgi:hypothetical protein
VILRKLSAILGGKKQQTGTGDANLSPEPLSERRAQMRFMIPGFSQVPMAFVRFNGKICQIGDLSYGGLAVDEREGAIEVEIKESIEAELVMLNKEIRIAMMLVGRRQASRKAGFLFEHRTPEALVFLRQFLEPMRWGTSMTLLDKNLVGERYRGEGYMCYRGDGPVDLIIQSAIKSDNFGGVKSAILTMPLGERYAEFTFRDGVVGTGITRTKDSNPGSQMAISQKPDLDIVRSAVCVLASITDNRFHRFADYLIQTQLGVD